MKSVYAFFNLALHFNWHFLRGIFYWRSRGLKQFIENYRHEGILLLTAEEKDLIPDFSRCLSCGLCDAPCPATGETSQEKFLGPSFIPHLARSIPDFVGVVHLDLDACEKCEGCELICPANVPIKRIIQFMRDKDADAKGSP